jgi:hypothetical protein
MNPARDIGRIAFGLAMVAATYVAAATWERVKTRPPDRTIQVTGSAKKRIVSDLIEWTGTIETSDPADRTAAYKTLRGHLEAVQAYLRTQGIKDDEIRASSVEVSPITETEHVGTGAARIERVVFKGYRTQQSITVRSGDVNRVERISREVTQLLDKGIPVTSSAPSYHYTKLGELKIEMLAEAAKDARVRAENMVKSAGGGAIDKLRTADMGVININPPNVTNTNWEGNNDTSSLEKDIITIVHVTYELH